MFCQLAVVTALQHLRFFIPNPIPILPNILISLISLPFSDTPGSTGRLPLISSPRGHFFSALPPPLVSLGSNYKPPEESPFLLNPTIGINLLSW